MMALEINILPDDQRSTIWRVEAIDEDGGVEVAIFDARESRFYAEQFAALVYGWTPKVPA